MKKINLTAALCTLFLLFFAAQTNGQGWRKTYDQGFTSFGFTLLNTPDGGYLLHGQPHLKTDGDGNEQWAVTHGTGSRVGNRRATLLPDGSYVDISAETGDAVLSKYDAFGTQIWSQTYPVNNGGEGFSTSVDQTADGGFVFAFNYWNLGGCGCWRYVIIRTDDGGDLIWQADSETDLEYQAISLRVLSDGAIATAGWHGNVGSSIDLYVEKRDDTGNLLWESEYFIPGIQQFSSVIEAADGSIVATGYGNETIDPGDEPMYLVKFDQNDGSEIWFSEWDMSAIGKTWDLKETPNGDFVVVGEIYPAINAPEGFIYLADTNGDEVWRREYLTDNKNEIFYSVQNCPSGSGFAIGGFERLSNGTGDALLLKTDALGNVYSHYLIGRVFLDEAEDCTFDGTEPGLENFIVTAEGDTETFYGSSDADGHYSILVDTGDYELSLSLPNGNWELCQASYPISASTIYDSTELNLPVQPGPVCPAMTVDISTPVVRPCFSSFYAVGYCNQGTETAIGATVEVTLAPELDFLGTTGNLLSQNGQVLTFDLGDVEINECGVFTIDFLTECDTLLVGETVCSEAHIFPDTICAEMYEGPEIEVSGLCENDSVKFEILNIGDDMPDVHEYIIIEDNIILMQGNFQLDQGQFIQVTEQALSGRTYHLAAAQDVNFPPAFGNPVATFSLEGCVGPVNAGAFNQLPQNEGEPWLAIDCTEATAAYDPNDKTPSPTGWSDENFIEARTDLEYRIRFQNTGTDTAFNVVIVDTLSQLLDPTTIRPGAASHPYTFELSGQGVAKFIFPNIQLPDSTTNEAASQGFVNFKISQMPDNQPGDRIENTAEIYFDFNAPIVTNTTFHTIREPWVSVVSGSVETFEAGLEVSVFPNPFFAQATFRLEGYAQNGTLEIFDTGGRRMLSQNFAAGQAQVQRENLPAGLYFFQMRHENGSVLASGKVIAQ